MKFGVNYVPSHLWFYSWQDFEIGYFEKDFKAIKNMGADHIRMHLRWDLFQPNQNYVSPVMLDRLVKLVELAGKYELEVYLSVFTGWMSGFWFLPGYSQNLHLINDEEAISAEKYFLSELSKVLMPLKAFSGIDLGNEFNMYNYNKKFTVSEGDKWLKEIMDYTLSVFPKKEVTLGVDHQPWFFDKDFSRKELANLGTVTSLHTWTPFTGANEYGATSDEVMYLQEFNVEFANAYSNDINRPVWIQEFGVNKLWMEEKDFEYFINKTMKSAVRSDNVWGFTFWCSHDVDRKLKGFNELEYDLGLFTAQNKIKTLGRYFSDCIADIKKGVKEKELKNGVAIVIDENNVKETWDYCHNFIDLIREGVHPKFVLSSKLNDKEYLKKRNISELVY